ncbi:MAG: glycosyltransferase family 4 protein [Desulfobacterales bacterium]|nr:glycosyltransferase family 4 protein [Desulfobacterales bacterium]
MKQLLIITTNFPPSTSIGTQRIVRICKYLDKSKWKIHVLTLKKKYYPVQTNPAQSRPYENLSVYRTEKIDILSYLIEIKQAFFGRKEKKSNSSVNIEKDRKNDLPQSSPSFSLIKSVKQVMGLVTDFMEFPDKEIAWVPFAVFKGLRIIRENQIDVICSSSPKHSIHLTTAILKVLTKTKLVIDFRDPWTRSPWHDEERASSALERFKHKILQLFERWVVEKADQVVFVTQQMKEDFAKYYSYLPQDKFKTFYNGYDPENIKFPACEKKREPSSKTVFAHIGGLYKRRDPTPLIYAVKKLKDQNLLNPEKVLFQFIGVVTDDLAFVKNLPAELEIEDIVKFIPKVTYQESLEYMMNSDVLLLLQPVTKIQLPAKFYDYICFEKPVFAVGEKDSAIESLVDGRFGIFADYNKTDDMGNAILSFLSNSSDKLSEDIKNNRDIFDMSKAINTFDKILDN